MTDKIFTIRFSEPRIVRVTYVGPAIYFGLPKLRPDLFPERTQ